MAKKRVRPSFAVCVAAAGSDDLRVWKLYRVLEDGEAAREGYLRVVDESGEDYLYSAGRFVVVQFPARSPSARAPGFAGRARATVGRGSLFNGSRGAHAERPRRDP